MYMIYHAFYVDSSYRFRDTLGIVFGGGWGESKVMDKVQGLSSTNCFIMIALTNTEFLIY